MLLEGKSAVITGSGSGVGRAAALVFAREGAKVVCADVREDWIDETVKLVAEQGGTAVAQPCNVTEEDQVKAAIDRAVDEFGRLDVMYNNVGVSTPRPGPTSSRCCPMVVRYRFRPGPSRSLTAIR